jgi:hypothetical protein
VANIVAARSFTTVQQVGNVSGVGPSTFHSLRNAAIDSPIDDLIAKVNAAHQDVALSLAARRVPAVGYQIFTRCSGAR